LCAPFPAFAHIGHVAEVAGHGHLVAIGAMVAAAVLGGLIVKAPKKQDADTEVENDPDDAEEGVVDDAA